MLWIQSKLVLCNSLADKRHGQDWQLIKQVQRRCEKNLRLCSYRLRRSVKNDPLPLSVHTGVRSALLKNKEKGIISSLLADKICKEANVPQKSIKLYCQLANLIHSKLECERLKPDANDFVQAFLSYVERVIPSLAIQFRQIWSRCKKQRML